MLLTSLRLIIMFAVVLSAAIRVHAEEADYRSITGPCTLSFPGDHGPHPGYRTEWWYTTGNLSGPDGERFGFQLTFFRTQIVPPGKELNRPDPASAWRASNIYLAHAAVSDLRRQRFYHEERVSREFPGVAGALQDGNSTTLLLNPWSAAMTPSEQKLNARSERFDFDLTLTPRKPAALHGDGGYSRKGLKPESASCYYSFSRLDASGKLTVGGETYPVGGTAWMDHEFSSAPLEPDVVGWDWFSFQFSDNTELMLYFLRRRTGDFSPASSGTFVDAEGQALHLPFPALGMNVLEFWKSPHSGAIYPSHWEITIHPLGLRLQVVPRMDDQELLTPRTTGVTYWEGSVSVSGNAGDRRLSGVGYVELTGYAHPMDDRM
jgi:predicted secreted hydrolase